MKRLYVAILIPKNYGDTVLYKLTRSITVEGITIPKGFVFDGATVPKVFWPLFPPVDKYIHSVALHDYLLSTGESWKKSNEYLFKSLRNTQIGKIRFNLIRISVSLYALFRIKFKGEK